MTLRRKQFGNRYSTKKKREPSRYVPAEFPKLHATIVDNFSLIFTRFGHIIGHAKKEWGRSGACPPSKQFTAPGGAHQRSLRTDVCRTPDADGDSLDPCTQPALAVDVPTELHPPNLYTVEIALSIRFVFFIFSFPSTIPLAIYLVVYRRPTAFPKTV